MKKRNTEDRMITKDFILLFFYMVTVTCVMNMMNVIVPLYVTGPLGSTTTMAGVMTTIYIIASCLSRPLSSSCTDRFGRRKTMSIGSVLLILSTLLMGLIPSLIALGILRVFMGMGYAAGSTACNTASTDVIPKSRMASGLGYFGISQSVGSAVGPPLATAIIMWAAGQIIFVSPQGFSILAVAAVSVISLIAALFIRYERREPKAVNLPGSYKFLQIEKSAVIPTIYEFFTLFFVTCVMNFITLYIVSVGLPEHAAGNFYLISSVIIVLIRLFCSRLMEKVPACWLMVPGYAALIAACLLLPHITSEAGIYGIAVLYGIEHGIVWMALGTEAVRYAPPERRGAANATFYFAFDAAIGIGAIVWGVLIDAYGYRFCFTAVAVACVVLAVVSIPVFRRKKML